MKKLLFFLFAFLIFFVPLVLWPFTSEVFEFNKIVLVYILTTSIVSAWLVRSILARKIIFRRTILDIPLLVFLASQIISTIFSIDTQTSLLGYYSRFNGGLISTICYSLLYWAFVSNFNTEDAKKIIKVWFVSAILVSVYAVLEHFGIDKNIWVQDVQSRVFSTLGQPNWLAAFLVALLPPIYNLQFSARKKTSIFNYLISTLFFATLLFTKSRSGILGFIVADFVYWGLILLKDFKNYTKSFVIYHLAFVSLALIIGTQFTPSLAQYFSGNQTLSTPTPAEVGPALETGGTESGTIRKIVWKGAIDVWKHYPIFGTGVETFAFSYQMFRPIEHNLVSEWDFIYNKAHNEYLNMAANSGSLGLISYLVLIGFVIFLMLKNSQINSKLKNSKDEDWPLVVALLAGFISLLVTNFFGFPVVPTQLELFLFPAIAVAITGSEYLIANEAKEKSNSQKLAIGVLLFITCYLLFIICQYWYADTLYAKGKAYNSVNKPENALGYLIKAEDLEPGQALYHGEIANSYVNLAAISFQNKNATESANFTNLALSESQTAIDLSPNNTNLKRSRFGIFIILSSVSPKYLTFARDTLIDAVKFSPTDPKLYYNLGLTYARTGELDKALVTLKKTIDLKPNYKEPRLAYAILLISKKDNLEAMTQLSYILKNIDPNDSLTKQTLESIK